MRIWTCIKCGTWFDTCGGGDLLHCPNCQANQRKLEENYWADKATAQWSIADKIVNEILECANGN